MSIMLPDHLVEVMEVLGFHWPHADEDKIRECGQAWKDYAGEVERVIADADRACREAVERNRGEAITAFEDHWRELGGEGDLRRATDAANIVSDALSLFADAVIAMKSATLIQLGIAAAAIIASVASAIFTAGLSTVAGGAAVQAARLAIREIIHELIEKLVKTIIPKLKHEALGIFEKMVKRIRHYLDEVVTKLRQMANRKGGPEGFGRTPDGAPGAPGRPSLGSGNGAGTPQKPADARACGDPVDVAAGRVLLTQTDVELAAALPLVLSRTHLSSYRVGRWFGPSWASTLDQRLEVEETCVYYAAEDGMLLTYPIPADESPVLPEAGPRWPLRRNKDGGYTVTDPQRGQTMHFGPAGAWIHQVLPLRAVTNRIGHRVDLDYDPSGTPTEVRHSGGYRIGVQTADGRITALRLLGAGIGRDGHQTLIRYGYDEHGRLSEVINSSGIPLRFDYDSAGRLTGWQDRNNVAYRYTYDKTGRCVRTSGADGYMNGTFTYDPENRVTVYTDSLGHPTTFHFNESDQVIREVDPLGAATVSVWDRYEQLLSRTDPLGRTTQYTYDSAGNLIEITRPDGNRARAEYNELRLPVVVTDPDGAVWRRVYDERGNLTAVTDPLGATTTYAYDERGHLAEITDALRHVRRVQTDAAGLPITVTDPLGATTHYTRDAFGRVTAITDPMGGVTRFGWTAEGKPAWRVMPIGAAERWRYDGEGNLVEYADALGQITRTEIGPFDLPAAEIGPDGARLEFAYDTELRLVSVTNPQGLVWRYDYDPAGNLVTETDFNHRELRYVHDAAGQLVERTNGAGQITRFVRDLLGNVVEQRSADAVATFTYDAASRMVRTTNADAEVDFERDLVGRVIAETCNGRTVTSGYDELGRRTRRRTPSGAESVWEYGAGEAPVALHTTGRTLRFDYDPAGREVQRDLDASAVLAQTWDANHRLTSQTLTAGGQALRLPGSARETRLVQRRSYGYRLDGYVTTIADHLSGLRRFDLDPVGRVIAVHGDGWTERYAYDPAGNITDAAWPTPPQDGSLDAAARGEREYSGTLIRRAGNVRYQHDAQGRVTLRQQKRLSAKPRTWHYTWNADDRLVGVTTPDSAHWRYHYDPLGRRIAKQRLATDGHTIAEQVDFTWDGTVLAEQTHTTGPDDPARTTSWDWEPESFRPLTQTERTSLRNAPQEWVDEQFHAIVTDLVGTPTEMLNPAGTLVWHPRTTLWGTAAAPILAGVSCPLRFPGQYFDDETQLNYNYYRYYDPAGGRYESNDPLGLQTGTNPHSYVPNPACWIDPLGLMNCDPDDLTRVGRWMGRGEHDKMVNTGMVQEGGGGVTYVAHPADPMAYVRQAKSGDRYVEFDVPASSLRRGGKEGWAKIPGPNSPDAGYAERLGRPAPPPLPKARNMEWVATKI